MKYRLLALLTVSAVLSGCTAGQMPEESDEQQPALSQRLDATAVKRQITALQDIWDTAGHEEEIQQGIDGFLKMTNDWYSAYIHAEMDYYQEWDNDALYEKQQKAYEDYCVADEMTSWTFANGYHESAYAELFAPYAEDESWVSYYTENTLSRVVNTARKNAADSRSLLDDYYDTAGDTETPQEEIDLSCAQLYLDTLETWDTSNYLYDVYARDYTAEQGSMAYDAMLAYLLPVYQNLADIITRHPMYDRLYETDFISDDPYDILRRYAEKLSPEIAGSAEKLIGEQLYRAVSGDNCYTGSYTVSLPGECTAMIYTYLQNNYSDLGTVTHEFGHFHAEWRDTTPVYLQQNCTDIAEVQSQGMEVLFTQFYDEIYGENADFMEMLTLYSMLDSIVCGLAIGEFEYEVMRDGNMTAEQVLECYESICDKCSLGFYISEISHLYEQPGYYISYGISALAAMELYARLQESPAAAMECYDKLSTLEVLSGKRHFCEAMESCGMSDVFAADTMEQIGTSVEQRIYKLNT